MRPDGGGIEAAAALGDNGVEVVERGEVLVGDRLVHQRPEPLGGLEFGAYGGRNTSVIPSGTAKPFGPCQPALSSTRRRVAWISGKGALRGCKPFAWVWATGFRSARCLSSLCLMVMR